ncbi:MAG: cofactor-independent phosphoglycerate mutase [Candidatus Faecousia sp.]|nr:cofactor-independent phosphoglycerate mutase [Oscillospiraceae bacterium]MDY2557768.1 cofactor-independent phosphoglycerate mutase [Candidatus Faecousia sp.]
MKYIVILGDGMADEPMDLLGGKTPMECADTPTMDAMACAGRMGMVQNVPSGMAPGSDVANLSVLGYDPARSYSGRSPLEALSVGVDMEEDDVIFRANIVTLTEEEPYPEKTILDHSSGEISTRDADVLMDTIRQNFQSEVIQFYTGTSYRHIMVWKQGKVVPLEPPHDHLGTKIGPWLPGEPMLKKLMEESFPLLNSHPLNVERAKAGKNKANSLWFWGAGTKPSLQNFEEKTGLKGAMISAVDLLKGIAVGAGMKVYQVPGATGSIDTNYEGKAQAAVKALLEDGCDFVYVHVEAPDEMGHQGLVKEKIQSISDLDHRLIAVVKEAMDASGEDYRMLILPDHPTPIRVRTHTGDPVPYLLYDSTRQEKKLAVFSEAEARAAGVYQPDGYKLIDELLK